MTASAPSATPASPAIRLALLLATALVLAGAGIDTIASGSIDLAHHYALVARVAQLWQLPASLHLDQAAAALDPSLGEMNVYPRGSHILAAIVGAVLHSPLLGMHLLGLLCAIGVWAALGAIVLALPRRHGYLAAALLAALLILNRLTLRLELHHDEVVGSYFFSQLVAQSMAAGALLAALLMERRALAPLLRHGLLIGAIYLLAGVHLLPASQLGGFLLALIGLEFLLRLKHAAGRRHWPAGALALGLMLATVLVLYRHPAFRVMQAISMNNGGWHIRHFDGMLPIFLYCLLILASSALLLARWIKLDQWGQSAAFLAFKYGALYGLAVAGLGLVQLLALKLGQGSEYAVKKHIFALNSVLLVQLSLFGAQLAGRRQGAAARAGDPLHAYLLLPLLTIAAFVCLRPQGKELDASDVVALERQLTLRRDLWLPETPGRHVYATSFTGQPALVSYMMTLGVFRAPRLGNSLDLLDGRALTQPELIGTILAAPESYYGKFAGCRQPGSTRRIAILDGACVVREIQMPRRFIGMTSGDTPLNCVAKGFGEPEGGGRWTEQKRATLRCAIPQIDGARARSIEFDTHAFLHEKVPAQRLSISLNHGPAYAYRYDAAQPARLIRLRLPAAGGDVLDIELALPDAIAPRQVGLGEDARQLGVMLKSATFN